MKKAVYSKSNKNKAATQRTKETTKSKSKSAQASGLKKQYMKSKPSCKVTFKLPKEAAPEAQMVSIVGDFNKWNLTENKMTRLKNGDFKLTLELPCNKEYKFRYLIDTNHWENDWFADKYIPNEYGSDDSVVVIDSNGG
jgi:1,4-alpha-glucan branching enzyme